MIPYRSSKEDFLETWESQWSGCFVRVRLKTQSLFVVEFQEEKSNTIFPILISTYNKGVFDSYTEKKKQKCHIGIMNYHIQGQTRYKLLWVQ